MEATRGKGKILIDGHFMPYSRLAEMVGDDDYGHTEDDNNDDDEYDNVNDDNGDDDDDE